MIDKLRAVAVDKDVLHFEIGLLEKFVITSEVVRDWGDYISRLLEDINQVMTTPLMFSLFRVGEDAFDLEIFWLRPPDRRDRRLVEVARAPPDCRRQAFDGGAAIHVRHHAPVEGEPLVLDAKSALLHTKSLMVDRPKIGGIVGIGVHAEMTEDETLWLVTDSILSTMLNVVGSVKAIHKYTRDMEYYATRDPLTDLYNRRVFWELFEYEVARAHRHGYQFALLVVDLDNFKLINDSFGHATGDIYLQGVARAMKKTYGRAISLPAMAATSSLPCCRRSRRIPRLPWRGACLKRRRQSNNLRPTEVALPAAYRSALRSIRCMPTTPRTCSCSPTT